MWPLSLNQGVPVLPPGLSAPCHACPRPMLMHTQAPAKKVESSDDSDDDSEEEAPKKAAAKPAAKPAAKAAAKVRSLHWHILADAAPPVCAVVA